jgi:hypothetical protein
MFGDRCRHLAVERGKHLILQIEDRSGDAPLHQVLVQFQSGEPQFEDDRLPDSEIELRLDAVHLSRISQREDPVQVNVGNRRPQWRGGWT